MRGAAFILLGATGAFVGCSEAHAGRDAQVDASNADTGTAQHADAGPDPCTTPGAIETETCGMCGTRERFCTSASVWEAGPCQGETGECLPGTSDMIPCGNCGTQTARCTAACTWDVTGACTGEGECAAGARMQSPEGCPPGQTREVVCGDACTYAPVGACIADFCPMPGEIEFVACGMCGTQERFCSASNRWEYGACTGEGECVPGASGTTTCGRCGTMTTFCDPMCTWVGTGACTGEGTCTPGERRTTTTTCAAGEARELECDASCALTLEVRPCTRTCSVPSDCPSGVCAGGFCAPASCGDGTRNGGETDIDCGGATTCPRCSTGRTCTATSDCATDTCLSGICGGVNRCHTGGARVLVYGPGGSTGSAWFPSGTTTSVASDAMWRAMTTADFGLYDVIVVAGNLCEGTPETVFGTLEDTISAWGPAIRGRMLISTDDADYHGSDPPAQLFYANLINWLKEPGRNADGGHTSLFISWGCTMAGSYVPGARGTPERFATVLGSPITGDGFNYCTGVARTAAGSSHPVLAGIPSSFWSCPFHAGFASMPSDYTALAVGTTGPSSAVLAARESPMPCIP